MKCEAKAQFPPNLEYQQDLRLLSVVCWGRWYITAERQPSCYMAAPQNAICFPGNC